MIPRRIVRETEAFVRARMAGDVSGHDDQPLPREAPAAPGPDADARRLAAGRHAFLRRFLARFIREWEGRL